MNALSSHGLSPRTLAEIHRVLAGFPQVERAVLFGSRAKGTHRPGSDVDLALYGVDLDWRVLGLIADEFDRSQLPYGFSLIQPDDHTTPEVAAHIDRVGRELYLAPAVTEESSAGLPVR